MTAEETLYREYLRVLSDDVNIQSLVVLDPPVYSQIVSAAAEGMARRKAIAMAKMSVCKIIPFPCGMANTK